jgi:hypothetical protein
MANAAVAITNLADAGTWTSTSSEPLMPITNLLNEHVSNRWRSIVEPATITVDLGANVSLDTVALMGLTIGTTATIQVLISTAAGGAASGNLHNVTYSIVNKELDPNYRMLVVALPAPVSGRFVRFVITDGPATYVEAGRGFVGLRETFTYNFAPGGGITWTDRSRRTKSAGGQTLIFRDNKFRTVDLNFEWVSSSQREGVWETLGRVNGNSVDVLLILDTASNNLCRDSIYGLVTSSLHFLYASIGDRYSAPITVEERL